MKATRWYLLCVMLGVLCLTASLAGAADIEAVKSYPSLASPLAELYLESRATPSRLTRVATAHRELRLSSDGSVLVWVMQAPGTSTSTVDTGALIALGGRVAGQSEHFLEAWIPVDALPQASEDVAGVTFLRPPMEWQEDTVTSEGVSLTGAAAIQAEGFRGAGTKVAVIDLNFGGLNAALGAGELPASTIQQNFTTHAMDGAGDSVHGTACAEIVYDMAPETQLYVIKIDPVLMSSTESAINYCLAEGVNVMSWSLGTVSGNFFDGQGDLCDLMNNAYAHGVLPVIAAGNYAGNSGEAHNQGTTVDADNDLAIEFASPDDEMMSFGAKAGQAINVWLTWNGWPTTSEDYDLYIVNGAQVELWSSTSPQTGTQPPVEGGTWTPPATGTYYLVIRRASTATATGIKYELYIGGLNSGLEYPVAQSSLTSPADAVGAVAVGAIAQNHWATGPQEAFSSQGPTNDGRVKPELCGPDAVHTYSYGTTAVFLGTSAATPHVAAAAALLKSMHPTWTATQVRDGLLTNVVDISPTGVDNFTGAGRLALSLPDIVSVTASANPTSVASGGTTQLSAAATDTEGHTSFTWSWSDNGANGTFSPSASVQNPTWTAPGNDTTAPASRRLTVTATCTESGASTPSDVIVTEQAPEHSLTVSPTASPSAVLSSGTTTLTAHASDSFGHTISYAWTDNGAGGAFSPSATSANPTYTAPANLSLADVTVTLSLTVTCVSAEPLTASDALTLTVHPHADFSDVPYNQWAFTYIESCFRAGIVQGYNDGSYQPALPVTRDQMAVYIARALAMPTGEAAIPTGPATATFEDVPNTGYGESGTDPYWAYKYIEYCVGRGVVEGYDPTHYRPTDAVTRDQMAVFVARAKGWVHIGDDMTAAPEVFPDIPAGFWSGTAVQACVENGVVQGYDDGKYHPEYQVTRDQMAVYIARAFNLM